MPCSLETLQSESCDSGIGRLTNPVQLLQIIAQLLCDISTGGGGGGGVGQIKIYVSDPNTEAITPDDPDSPGIAYTEGVGATYVWDVTNQEWI